MRQDEEDNMKPYLKIKCSVIPVNENDIISTSVEEPEYLSIQKIEKIRLD